MMELLIGDENILDIMCVFGCFLVNPVTYMYKFEGGHEYKVYTPAHICNWI